MSDFLPLQAMRDLSLLLFAISSFTLQSVMAQTKATLIYVGDPMCSWCYGFAEEINKAVEDLKDKADFQLVMGGLRPYNTETMADLGDFLKHHWEQVNQRSGQPFKYDILSDKTFVYDTEPPSRAVIVMRKLKPEAELAFFKQVQRAFYMHNKNTNLVDTYLELANEFGVDPKVFQKEFESEEMKSAAKAEFAQAAAMGVRSFPTVLLRVGESLAIIANGYTTAQRIESAVEEQLQAAGN